VWIIILMKIWCKIPDNQGNRTEGSNREAKTKSESGNQGAKTRGATEEQSECDKQGAEKRAR
jgi:hypothetical protein